MVNDYFAGLSRLPTWRTSYYVGYYANAWSARST